MSRENKTLNFSKKTTTHLERYCGQDKKGIIWVVEVLERLCSIRDRTGLEPSLSCGG